MRYFLILFSLGLPLMAAAQDFSRADSLRGALRPERTAFDITFYELDLSVDIDEKSISGSTVIHFRTLDETVGRMQIDLFKNMKIKSIKGKDGQALTYNREANAVFIDLPKGNSSSPLTVTFQGTPVEAKNPPWDGGFAWKKDKNGNPWVGVACEGIGASLWWPNKDHLSDEPDSMSIRVTVPSGLVAVANGNLRQTEALGEKTKYHWFVSYPINNYNVSVNIAKYAHFTDTFAGSEGTYNLDYYVLDYNLDKAKKHFEQVKPMLECYDRFLGPYPFPNDGFALVETPYLGMEHQGAIAYGNGYLPGYQGYEISMQNLDFDYIIIHETGHEYWGNSVSMKDVADMWIHEGFCTYSEILYIECHYGKEKALNYANAWKNLTANDRPVIGPYHVNKEGSGDMYYKGALMLHTLRWIVDNDSSWFALLKDIQKDFRFKTTSSEELIAYINGKLGADYGWFFHQYLERSNPPMLNHTLVQKGNDLVFTYQWDMTRKDFRLPLRVTTSKGIFSQIEVTTSPGSMIIRNMEAKDFEIDERHAYFMIKWE